MKTIVQRAVFLFPLLLSPAAQADGQGDWSYPMQPGESIWSIAHELMTDWREWKTIERINGVLNDRRMPPGTVLRIPKSLINEQPSEIKILEVSGTVSAQVKMNSGDAKAQLPLVRGQSLSGGDLIKTAEQSSVLIEFADGSQVLILENSVLRIEQATVVGETRKVVDVKVFLEEGDAEIRANPAKVPGSQFLIDTPAAFATTKGTSYRVRAEGELTAAEVTEGVIAVGNPKGERRVKQGFGTLTRKDQAPTAPQKLLPAPELPELTESIRYLPGKLEWSGLEGAAHYRAQIAPDQTFAQVVYDRTSDQPKMGLPTTLLDQTYWVRVVAVSPEGLQGLPGITAVNINARPFPPVKQSPRSNDALYAGTINFAWTRPEQAEQFQIDVAEDETFAKIVTQQRIAATSVALDLPDAGHYFWRVTSIDGQGKIGPAGFSSELKVKPVPPTPAVNPPAMREDELYFSWQAESGVASYQLQLASDPDFNEIVSDLNTAEANLTLAKPAPANYYLRVRSLDSTQHAGEWSPVQKINVPLENGWPLIFGSAAALLLLL